MSDFLAAALSFPTVVYTVALVFFLLYALATLLGAADIEWLDHVLHIDHANDTIFEGALSFLGISGVPVMIFGGVASVFAWVASIAAMKFVPDSLLFAILAGLGAGVIGLGLGSLAVRPLHGIFNTATGPQRSAIVGKVCTVRSLRVDATSGTAEVDGGAGFIAEVRCMRENDMTRGSKAIVYDYDPKEGIYFVGPLDRSVADVDAALITARSPQAEL